LDRSPWRLRDQQIETSSCWTCQDIRDELIDKPTSQSVDVIPQPLFHFLKDQNLSSVAFEEAHEQAKENLAVLNLDC
jgi:hypothetical protein